MHQDREGEFCFPKPRFSWRFMALSWWLSAQHCRKHWYVPVLTVLCLLSQLCHPPTTLTKAPNLPHPHPGHLQSPLWTHTSSALTAAQPNNTRFALPIYLFCHLYPHKPILPASEALPVLLLYHLAMLISKCFAHCPLEVTHSTHEKTIES